MLSILTFVFAPDKFTQLFETEAYEIGPIDDASKF